MIYLISLYLLAAAAVSAQSVFETEARVVVLNDQNFDPFLTQIKEENAVAMIEFYAPWCPHCKQLIPEYEKAAKSVEGLTPKIYLAKYDCDAHTEMKKRYEVRGYPSLKIWRVGKSQPIEYGGDRKAKDIVKELKIQAGIEKRPKPKSQPIPEESKQNGVMVVVGETFLDLVKDETKNVLIFFYAPWCSHCKKFKPKYEKFAQKYAHIDDLVVAKIDATANDWDKFNYPVNSYPTVYLATKTKKDAPVKFSGERTVQGLAQFLELKQIINTDL